MIKFLLLRLLRHLGDWQLCHCKRLSLKLHIFYCMYGQVGIATRGQWPYRPASKRAMKNKHMMLHDFNYFGTNVYIAYNSHLNGIWGHYGLPTASMASKVKYDPRFETSNLNYHGIDVHIDYNSFLGGLWGHGGLQMPSIASEVKFDLRFEISNHIYPGFHVHVASYSHFGGFWGCGGLQMTSEATYDLSFEFSELNYLCPMLLWPVNDLRGHIWPQIWTYWPQLPMLPCLSSL